ncbi:MAG TPA: hypothetical protein VK463_20430 [Desulfomonilaceae bacterium]|nr:hypothetical protein [Desulfomonilaceae bacterium]
MVKKSAVILGVLAILTLGVGMSWSYTVTQWPVPGIPNTVFCGGSACMVTPEDLCLKGPVAPACEPPLVPGIIHAALSVPFRAVAIAATPLFQGGACPGEQCCKVDLGEPAYVMAAVPCTPVNIYTPPKGW